MSKYPEVITPEILAKQEHILTSEIVNDIKDTQSEIQTRERRLRMLNMEAEALEQAIKERQEFIEYLERLIAARKE